MAYKDLREWLSALEKAEELLKVQEEVDWNLEVGAITRRVYDLMAPVPLFENIKDYPGGYRILGAPIGLSARNRYARLALALNMPVNSTVRDITEEYIRRKKTPIKPIIVNEGPCQENVHTGDKVDLFKLPAPLIHEGDGGRYISTWHATITKDPLSGWVNYGMYRQMIHDKNHLGGHTGEFQHIRYHLGKYVEMGKNMEFAVVLGAEPVTPIIAATAIGVGVNEVDIIGAIREEPLPLVKCKTVDLYVPATAEIVIEGYVDPNEKKEEGPFGEYPGYSAGGRDLREVYTVTAITHRNDPILPMSCMGVPVDDSHVFMPIVAAAEILEELRNKQFPVDFVYIPPEGVQHFCVISTKVPYKTYPKHLAMTVWATKAGHMNANFLTLVNDDVDITDLKQIIWAISTRVHPERGIWQVPHTYSVPLLPWLTPEERKRSEGARVLIDATWPADWPKEWIARVSSFTSIWPKQIQEKVLNKWKSYGFKD